MSNWRVKIRQWMDRWMPGFSEDQGTQKIMSKAAISTFGLQLLHIGLTFLTTFLLTNLLGAKEYGKYVYAMTWLMVLVTAASIGADDLLMKEMPGYRLRKAWGYLKGLVQRTLQWTLLANLLFGLSFYFVVFSGYLPFFQGRESQFRWVIAILPLYTLSIYFLTGLRAQKHLLLGQWPMKVGRPLLFLLLFAGAAMAGRPIGAEEALIYTLISFVGLFLFCLYQFRRKVWQQIPRTIPSQFAVKAWRGDLTFFFLLPLLHLLNEKLDVLLVGSLLDDRSTGIYHMGVRLSELLVFSTLLFHQVFAPFISDYHSSGQLDKLQRMMTKGIRFTFWIALPPALVLILAGPWLLPLFGPEFSESYPVLLVLCPAQLVFLFIGPTAFVLMMTGHGRAVFGAMLFNIVVIAGLQGMLIPGFGLLGATWAKAIGLLVSQGLYAWLLFQKLGIRATALGFLQKG